MSVGNLTNRIDGLSNSWQTVSNAMSRPVATIDPLGRTNSFTYDAGDNRLTVTRPDGTTSTNSYDSMNRLVKTVDPLNQTNSFAYNDRDQLVTLTDAKGNVTTWAYDALGRQTNKLYAPPGAVPATRKRLGLRQSSGAFHRPRQRQRTAALQDAAAPSAAPPPSVAL